MLRADSVSQLVSFSLHHHSRWSTRSTSSSRTTRTTGSAAAPATWRSSSTARVSCILWKSLCVHEVYEEPLLLISVVKWPQLVLIMETFYFIFLLSGVKIATGGIGGSEYCCDHEFNIIDKVSCASAVLFAVCAVFVRLRSWPTEFVPLMHAVIIHFEFCCMPTVCISSYWTVDTTLPSGAVLLCDWHFVCARLHGQRRPVGLLHS